MACRQPASPLQPTASNDDDDNTTADAATACTTAYCYITYRPYRHLMAEADDLGDT